MKYDDYPETIPNNIVEKLNSEFEKSKPIKTMQNEMEIQIPASFNSLSDLQVQNLAENLVLNYSIILNYLDGYIARSSNRQERQSLNMVYNSLLNNKTAISQAFNIDRTTNLNLNGETRRCLKLKILSGFYDILFSSNLLLSQNPSNFGLYQTNQRNLNALFEFISIVI